MKTWEKLINVIVYLLPICYNLEKKNEDSLHDISLLGLEFN